MNPASLVRRDYAFEQILKKEVNGITSFLWGDESFYGRVSTDLIEICDTHSLSTIYVNPHHFSSLNLVSVASIIEKYI